MASHAGIEGPSNGIARLPRPERPAFSASPPRLLIIGAGNRGKAYAQAIRDSSNGVLCGVVEPVERRRRDFGRRYIWGPTAGSAAREGQEFPDWPDFVAWEQARRARAAAGEQDVPEGVDAVFVCVQDQMHKDVVLGLAPLELHVMCEKPLAPNLADCMEILNSLLPDPTVPPKRIFTIGHVLRYSPHNMLLRKLLVEDRVVGEIMAVNHTEPVGWYHFAHSYVRGNWRNEKTSAPSLLAKSCHDMDLLYWLMAAPAPGSSRPVHVPTDISSAGSLQYFTRHRKPAEAGAATNCLSCGHEPACQFSARRIYTGADLAGPQQSHFAAIVAPEADIEECLPVHAQAGPAKAALLARLADDYVATTPPEAVAARNWFGRCVWESDNDVCDNQTVTLSWDGHGHAAGRSAKTATLHMVAFTERICQRETHVYGDRGEVHADGASITVRDFAAGAAPANTTTHYPHVPEGGGHGDGDAGLTRQFVLAVDRVKNHGEDVVHAQREHLGCALEDIMMSHALVFAAEEARRGRKVVHFPEWWAGEVAGSLGRGTGLVGPQPR